MSRAILKSTSATGLATLLSRITGMLRDTVMAQALGAGPVSDAFLVAYKIPNFLRRLFAEGAFSQSFVPVISEYRTQRGNDEVRELVAGVAGTLGVVLLGLSVLGVIAAPVIIFLFAPKWALADSAGYDLAVQMLRWTFPYLFFVSLTSLFSGVLNSYGKFVIPAVTQVVMNVVLIGTAIFFAPHSDNPGVTLVDRRIRVGRAAGVVPVAVGRAAAPARMAALAAGDGRRAPHREAHGARHRRLVDGADQPADRHADRDRARLRQRDVALLRRPPDGISARHLQHRARHRDPPRALGASRGEVAGRIHADARLGTASGRAARVARRPSACCVSQVR